jgi:hypothetical protein
MGARAVRVRDQYPRDIEDVEAGQLGAAIDALRRAQIAQSAVTEECRGWQERLRVAEALIHGATPSSDFPAVAAALAERDVITRALERRAPAIAGAARAVARYEREAAALGAEYRRLLATIEYLEELSHGPPSDSEPFRRRLVEVAGPSRS